MDNFIGEIKLYPYTRIPNGWMPCNGQSLVIQQNAALYALLGLQFGGNNTNFNLPNLNGRAIVGAGINPTTGTAYVQGQSGGAEGVTLSTANLPQHTHYINVNTSYDIFPPGTNFLGNPNTPTQTKKNTANANLYNAGTAPMTTLPTNTIASIGGGQAHENRQPYLPLVYCIATTGIFPPRP